MFSNLNQSKLSNLKNRRFSSLKQVVALNLQSWKHFWKKN